MTHEETIDILDTLLVSLNGQCFLRTNLVSIQKNIVDTLYETSVSNTVLNAILGITVAEYTSNHLAQYSSAFYELERKELEEYHKSLKTMINILQEERERLKRIMDEENQKEAMKKEAKNLELQEKAIAEQKEANRISKRALWFSAIATLASVIATVISIIALYK